jgi:hypothetical protein
VHEVVRKRTAARRAESVTLVPEDLSGRKRNPGSLKRKHQRLRGGVRVSQVDRPIVVRGNIVVRRLRPAESMP